MFSRAWLASTTTLSARLQSMSRSSKLLNHLQHQPPWFCPNVFLLPKNATHEKQLQDRAFLQCIHACLEQTSSDYTCYDTILTGQRIRRCTRITLPLNAIVHCSIEYNISYVYHALHAFFDRWMFLSKMEAWYGICKLWGCSIMRAWSSEEAMKSELTATFTKLNNGF